MHLTLMIGLAFGLYFNCVFASANEAARELSPAARAELKWFRHGGPVVDHGDENLTRVRSKKERAYLQQTVNDHQTLHLYTVDVGGLSEDMGVTSVEPFASSAELSAATVPSVSPWVVIKRSEADESDLTFAFKNWRRASRRSVGQNWRSRRLPREEEQVVAIGRRELIGATGRQSRLIRVQRFFRLKSMLQEISIQLEPVDADGEFRGVMIVRDGVRGELRVKPPIKGEIIGFRATFDHVWIMTSDLAVTQFAMGQDDGNLVFTPEGRTQIAPERVQAEWTVRRSREIRPGVAPTCAGRLTAADPT